MSEQDSREAGTERGSCSLTIRRTLEDTIEFMVRWGQNQRVIELARAIQALDGLLDGIDAAVEREKRSLSQSGTSPGEPLNRETVENVPYPHRWLFEEGYRQGWRSGINNEAIEVERWTVR